MTEAPELTSAYHQLLEKNARFLWNPFTRMDEFLADEPLIVERAEGVRLYDVDGREYLDGNSSLWVNVHGHGRRELNEAIAEQLDRIAHSTLLGLSNVPAIELAARLAELTPASLGKVFFSDAGAAAVEIAVKIAFGYWRRVGRPEKRRFLAMRNAYHGDTIGAVSLGGIDLFHAEFGPLLFDVDRVSYPCSAASLAALREHLERHADELACVAIEPLVQAAGGMIVMPPGFLAETARLVREHGVLLLCDEVATGFGRTGRMFACEHEGVEPDLMTVGKGLTGGYLPVAATLASDAIYDAFLGEDRTFFHGHSFTGNQLGCAVALASLDLFERDDLVARVAETAPLLGQLLAPIAELPHVAEIRQCGFMVGIELSEAGRAARACRRARALGLITRPLGDVVTLLPPLATPVDDLERMASVLLEAIAS